MNKEEIADTIENQFPITFNSMKFLLNTSTTIFGLLVQGSDYDELKTKNIWRFVKHSDINQWFKAKDVNLTELISGDLIVRIQPD